MSIKGGQILTQAGEYVIDRVQTAGAGQINIPEEKIKELGNYETVATVKDIPDLSFDVESLDVSLEFEALLTNTVESAIPDGGFIDFNDAVPLNIISPYKSSVGAFDIIRGVATPYLTLENVSYRFGVRQSATQSFSLRGDGIYYVPGAPYAQDFVITAGANQTYTFDETALPYTEAGDTLYALSVHACNSTDNSYVRLFINDDYTNTVNDVTVLDDLDAQGYDSLHVVYGTAASISYTQSGNNPHGNVVHEGVSVKPAAVRGKDIDLYISDGAATPTLVRWGGVQNVEITRSVNLENEEELGNFHYVSVDYDTADVTGSVTLRSPNPTDLFNKIANIANVSTNEIAGAHSATDLEMEVRISDPDTGDVLKTFYISDARFTIPSAQGQVDSTLEVQLNFTSDGGNLLVYKGSRA